jgi:hypothetical protein
VFVSVVVKNPFGLIGARNSHNSPDMTDPQPKYHAFLIVDGISKCCDIRKAFSTKHGIEILFRMMQLCADSFFI